MQNNGFLNLERVSDFLGNFYKVGRWGIFPSLYPPLSRFHRRKFNPRSLTPYGTCKPKTHVLTGDERGLLASSSRCLGGDFSPRQHPPLQLSKSARPHTTLGRNTFMFWDTLCPKTINTVMPGTLRKTTHRTRCAKQRA